MSGWPMSQERSLGPGHYIAVYGADGRAALASYDDPIARAARRALAGKADTADYEAIARWLDDVVPAPAGQLVLFRAAA